MTILAIGRRAARAAAPLPGPRGVIEAVVGDRLVGWAHDPSRPFRRLAVVATDGTGRHVRVLADAYRADLQQAGLGDGHAGFSLPLEAFEGADSVSFVLEASGLRLEGSPIALGRDRAVETRQVGTVLLGLDPTHLSGLRCSGWVIDRTASDHSVRLALVSAGVTLAEARACLYRPDRAAVGDEAYCGFVLDWGAGAALPLALHDARSGARLAKLR